MTDLYRCDMQLLMPAESMEDALKKMRELFGSPLDDQVDARGYVIEDIGVYSLEQKEIQDRRKEIAQLERAGTIPRKRTLRNRIWAFLPPLVSLNRDAMEAHGWYPRSYTGKYKR